MRLILIVAFLVIFVMPIEGLRSTEGSNVLLDPTSVCKKSRRLHGGRGRLHEICRHDSSLLKEIINGINLGFRECEFQFTNRRWNCTTLRKSMRKILMKDTRETAFVNAVTAAGVTFAVTRACTMGNLVECSCDKNHLRRSGHNGGGSAPTIGGNSSNKKNTIEMITVNHGNNSRRNSNNKIKNASIDDSVFLGSASAPPPPVPAPALLMDAGGGGDGGGDGSKKLFGGGRGGGKNQRKKGNNRNNGKQNKKFLKNLILPDGEWEWGGCGDNVNFGFRKSKDFLDAKYKKRSDIRTLVKLHNNNAGRLAVRDFMRLECKCHGLSGSCTLKTCWLKMPSFREVGARLMERFDGAAKVIARNDGNSFMPEGPTIKPPSKLDLVYTDESPDFCGVNHKTGSLGTIGRECNATSPGIDGCDLLCCNRGYDHRIVKEKVNCKCVFKWCCEVSCSTCIERREMNTCR